MVQKRCGWGWIMCVSCVFVSCASTPKKTLKLPEPKEVSGQWIRDVSIASSAEHLDVLESRVLVHGLGRDPETRKPVYRLESLDPITGDALESYTLPFGARDAKDITTQRIGDRFMVQSPSRVYIVTVGSKGTPIRYDSVASCSIRAAYLASSEHLVIDHCGKSIAVHTTASSSPLRVYTNVLWTTLGAVRSQRHDVLLLTSNIEQKDSDTPELEAFALDVTDSPTKESDERVLRDPIWSVEMSRKPLKLRVLGSVLLGDLFEGELHALDLDRGKLLWRSVLVEVDGRPLETDRWLVFDSLKYPGDSSVLPGRVRQLRAYAPQRGPTSNPSWKTVIPSGFEVLGFDGVGPKKERLFTATQEQLLVLDHATGRVLWGYALDPNSEQVRWISASANSRAAFLLMRRGRLKRIEIEYE